jgi:hypothetical protein
MHEGLPVPFNLRHAPEPGVAAYELFLNDSQESLDFLWKLFVRAAENGERSERNLIRDVVHFKPLVRRKVEFASDVELGDESRDWAGSDQGDDLFKDFGERTLTGMTLDAVPSWG